MEMRKQTGMQRVSANIKNGKIVIIAIFILLFLWGVKSYDDYGICYDDPVQRRHSLVTYKELFLGDTVYHTSFFNSDEIPSLPKYGILYGVALQLPVVALEHAFGFELSMEQVYLVRHAYIFLWFFVAAIFFYRLCLLYFGRRRWIGIFGVLLFILSPRLLADANYNIKDMLCFSTYTVALYYGMRLLKKYKPATVLLFAVATAICTSIRIVGGSLVAALCLIELINGIKQRTIKTAFVHCFWECALFGVFYFTCMPVLWCRIFGEEWKTAVILIVAASVALLLIWFGSRKIVCIEPPVRKKIYVGVGVATAAGLWTSHSYWLPLIQKIFNSFLSVFSMFGNYAYWNSAVLHFGKWVLGSELPADYLFVWMGITLPVGTLVFFLAGMIVGMVRIVKYRQRKLAKLLAYQYALLLFAIPVLYFLLLRPTLYNGWRHMYFLFNIVAFFAVAGFAALLKHVRKKKVLWWLTIGFTAGSFACTGIWILKNHPYEFSYFNPLVRPWVVGNFEIDYWFATDEECYRYIVDTDDRERITAWFISEKEDDFDIYDRIDYVRHWYEADYVVGYTDSFDADYYFRKVYEVKNADGMMLNGVWRRWYEMSEDSRLCLRADGGLVTQSHGVIQWNCVETEGGYELTGELKSALLTETLAVFTEGISIDTIEASVSSDGEEWYKLADSPEYRNMSNRISAECLAQDLKYIRLFVTKEAVKQAETEVWIRVECLAMGENIQEIRPSGPIETITTCDNEYQAPFIYDNSYETWWESGRQRKDLYLEITLREELPVSGVYLCYGEKWWDYPRDLRLEVSLDGEVWTEVLLSTEDTQYYFCKEIPARYMRLRIGSEDEEIPSNWSVFDLKIMH